MTPSNTRIIGYPSSVDLNGKRSALVNNEIAITDLDDIKSYLGLDNTNPIIASVDNDSITGNGIVVQSYNSPFIYSNITSSGTHSINPLILSSIDMQAEQNIENASFDVKYLEYLLVFANNSLRNLSLPFLTKLSFYDDNTNGFVINYNSVLETIDIPLLETIEHTNVQDGYFDIQIEGNTLINLINIPSLKNGSIKISGNTQFSSVLNCTVNIDSLENPFKLYLIEFQDINIDLSVIKTASELYFNIYSTINGIQTIDLPNLKYFVSKPYAGEYESILLNACLGIQNFILPNLIECYDGFTFVVSSSEGLNNIVLGTPGILKKANAPYISLFGAATFTSEEAYNAIRAFVSLDGTNGTTLSENGFLGINVILPVSTQLQEAFDTLTSRGWTILLND